MKKLFKNNIKLLIGIIIGLILGCSAIYVVATTYYSNNVVYNNANSTLTATNVQDALDELYRKSVGPTIVSIVDNEDLTATVNIAVTIDSVEYVCVNSYAKTTDDCSWKTVSGTSFMTNAVASAGSYYVHVMDTGGRISHSSSVSLTLSLSEILTTFDTVYLNSTFTGTTYSTASDAMDSWTSQVGVASSKPFYLKHIIDENNVVVESYGALFISEVLANSYSGMTPGTYYLRGGVDESSLSSDQRTIYNANKEALATAFGSSRCTEYDSYYSCSISNNGSGITFMAAGSSVFRGVCYVDGRFNIYYSLTVAIRPFETEECAFYNSNYSGCSSSYGGEGSGGSTN